MSYNRSHELTLDIYLRYLFANSAPLQSIQRSVGIQVWAERDLVWGATIERDGRSSCLGFTCTNLFMFIISPEQQTDWRACVGWYPTGERSHSRSILNLSSDSHHHQYTPCVNISGIEQELLCTAEFKLRPRRSTLVFNRWRVVHYGQFSTYRSPWNINRPRVR